MSDDFIKPTLNLNGTTGIDAEAPEILPSDLTFGPELAKGSFGTVYKGMCRGEIVAIKELNDLDQEALHEFKQEVAIMRHLTYVALKLVLTLSHLRHPNIVLLMGAVTRGDVLCIVTEYCKGGDLDGIMHHKSKEFSLAHKAKLLQDIALGMNWLHCSVPPIIHRDLKPGNILLSDDLMTAKVGDLGLSTVQHRNKIRSYGAGSYLWMSPESLLELPHTEKVDVYSYGMVMWQLLDWNCDPFKKYLDLGDLKELIEAVCNRQERPEIPDVHPALKRVVQAAWAQESTHRPSFAQILPMLGDAVIEAVVTDSHAAAFWKANWGWVDQSSRIETTQQIVPFEQFAKAFYKELKEPFPPVPLADMRYLCLRALVAEKYGTSVTLERFAMLFKWFGRMKRKSQPFLTLLLTVLSNPWFHGDISKEEAQSLLSTIKKTTPNSENIYLVRLSTSEPIANNPFTISKISSFGGIVHQRVYYDSATKEHYITVKEDGESKKFASKRGIVGLISSLQKSTSLLAKEALRTKYHEVFSMQTDDLGYLDEVNQ